MSFSHIVLYFTVYSLVGWLIETVACSIVARRYVNRGVLGAPFCPMYGFAAILALALAQVPAIRQTPPLAFAACAVALPMVKYITGWLLEKLFSLRLWDDSRHKLNLGGRIWWLDVLLLGLFGSAVIYLAQPVVRGLTNLLVSADQRVLASVLFGVFALEAYKALSALSRLTVLLRTLRDSDGMLPPQAEKPKGSYAACYRLLRAYPRLQAPGYEKELSCLHEQWDTQRDSFMGRLKALASAFGQKTADTVRDMNPFAHGVSFYKLVWVFAIGCVLGYLIETAFCLVVRGIVESRQGMVYGPFNQVYGMGAVLMTLTLQPLAKRGDGWLFVGGALVGGAFEFVASWAQENVLGTVSWEYSDQAFSIGGRTSLLFMFFWGILGVCYIRLVYPRISGLIEQIPKRSGAFFSWIIVIVLTADMGISLVAVDRWIHRQKGAEAANAMEVFIDAHYPDAMMQEIYPSMMIVEEDGARPSRADS